MSSDSGTSNPYAAVLADLRAKRTKLDNTIKALEELSGLKLTGEATNVPFTPLQNNDGEPSSGGEDAGAGAFLGMSIVDAAKKLLAMRKRAMSNPEIARELKAGGLVLNSVDPVNTIGSVLTRRFMQVGDVVKIARGTWGLKEWYPNRTFKPTTRMAVSTPADEEDLPMTPNPDLSGTSSE